MKIEIQNVTKVFDHQEVIKKCSLTLTEGHIYGFIGRNGSGKSVMLKMICGFYTPTTGEILLDGKNYNQDGKFPPSMGALIEKPNFIADLTGFENLKLLASIQKKINDSDINKILDEVHLNEDRNKKYHKYSLGTKQKLGIAQAIMEDPEVIVLDEPFNGVENETAEQIRTLLLKLKKKGKLIIIASHIKEDIAILADEVYEFDAGMVTKMKK